MYLEVISHLSNGESHFYSIIHNIASTLNKELNEVLRWSVAAVISRSVALQSVINVISRFSRDVI